MLRYRKGWGGIFLLLRLAGTSWPHAITPGLLSAGLGLVLSYVREVDEEVSDEDAFVSNPYPYQLFAYLVGFVLVFRTNFGYSRYWEALDAVQRMGAKWLDGACMAIVFDAKGDVSRPFLQSSVPSVPYVPCTENRELATTGPEHEEFFGEVVHLFSLIHALALQHLRCDGDLSKLVAAPVTCPVQGNTSVPSLSSSTTLLRKYRSHPKVGFNLQLTVLGGISTAESRALESDLDGHPVPSSARVAMVESWIMRRLLARQKYEPAGDMCKTAAPILSRMVQVISDGNLGFSQAAKVAETPFPFPYHNIIALFLWIFAITAPFIINSKVLSVPARFTMNFVAVWAYFSLAEVGDNLEDPYMPYDPNDLPLEAIHHGYNARLLSLGVVPGPPPAPPPQPQELPTDEPEVPTVPHSTRMDPKKNF